MSRIWWNIKKNPEFLSDILKCKKKDLKFFHHPKLSFHVISCRFMPFPVISRHFSAIHAISRHFMPCHAIRKHFMSFHIISHHFTSFHVISHHFMAYHGISLHFMAFQDVSYHFRTFHAISRHLMGYHGVWNTQGHFCNEKKFEKKFWIFFFFPIIDKILKSSIFELEKHNIPQKNPQKNRH